MQYREWLSDWLDNYVQPSVKQRTYTRYREIVEQHMVPLLGDMELSDISPYVLQCYVTQLLKNGNLRTGEGLSPNSVNSIITVIQGGLRTAYSLGLVEDYCGDKIKRPKSVQRKIECLTVAEQKKIESEILKNKNPRMFGIVLCLYTGLRIGELLALEWSDVDFKKREITVRKTCFYGKDTSNRTVRVVSDPKTPSSERIIPVPKQLIPYLREIHKKSRSAYVVANGTKPVLTRAYQDSFTRLLKRLNIPHRGFHSLRHTFATRALECGVDVKTLSEILGHRSPTITLERYAHSLTKHKKDMMDRIGSLL